MNDSLKKQFKQAIIENTETNSFQLEKQSLPISIFIIPGIFFTLILAATYFLNPYSNTGPIGKIKTPKVGSVTQKEFKVVGETRNIESGQYIWLAVDKPGIGLCWPKVQIAANTKFSTSILEEGPKGSFTLSIYILNKNFHEQWKGWQDRKIFGGLHMPPKSKRLNSVKLVFGG